MRHNLSPRVVDPVLRRLALPPQSRSENQVSWALCSPLVLTAPFPGIHSNLPTSAPVPTIRSTSHLIYQSEMQPWKGPTTERAAKCALTLALFGAQDDLAVKPETY